MTLTEKQFYLPGNICNNNVSIKKNQQIYERNFILPSNIQDNKLYQQPVSYQSRPISSYLCHQDNSKKDQKQDKKKCLQKCSSGSKYNNICSLKARVINQESDLLGLYHYDTKCPKRKYIMTNSNDIAFDPFKIDPNLVGVKNPACSFNSTYKSVSDPNYPETNINLCLDPERLPQCRYNNYLQGQKPAAAQSDVQACSRNLRDCHFEKNQAPSNWTDYLQISNSSSDIVHPTISNQLVQYTMKESLPFMLEDVRVRKIPDDSIQNCQNLFNNMTKRKSLFEGSNN